MTEQQSASHAVPATLPPTWDLDDLFNGPDDPALVAIIDGMEARAQSFSERWRDRVGTLSASDLAVALTEYESLVLPIRRAATYANLRVATNGEDQARQALANRIAQATSESQQHTIFLELELLALSGQRMDALLADPALVGHEHYLRRMRRRQPFVLGEPEERVITALGPTGPAAWQRLFANLTSSIQVQSPDGPVPLEVATAALQHPDRAARNGATEAISMALMPTLDVRASIFDTLLQDKAIRDRLRGYPTWLTDRNMANEVTDPQVDSLIDAVTGRYDLVARWYRLKARLLGLSSLGEHDRYAPLPLGEASASHSWDDARDLVLAAYDDFSPIVADIARQHFDRGWIDAVPGETKQPGAFCTAVPGGHPYINLSFTGTDTDVMTIAHELGHGIHGWLQRNVRATSFDVPLTMAETASVFGEAVTYRRLAAASPDDGTTLRLLARRIDGEIATIFRQVAMCTFERQVHGASRAAGQLSIPDINALWMDTQQQMFGDSVVLGERYSHWWSSVPHFVAAPGYVYAYAFGNLLAFALLERFSEEGDDFVSRYLSMLAKGGSEAPEVLLAPLGVDLADPSFWQRGLSVIEGLIGQAEVLADTVRPEGAR